MAAGGTSKQEPLPISTTVLIGATAGATAKTVVAPLERVRLLMQMANARDSARAGLSAVLRSEGAIGLWRGNGLAVVRATLSKGTLFATQDIIATRSGSDMVGGALAGLLAGSLTYPLDLLRTRLAGTVGHATFREVASEVVRVHGPLALYRGAPATLFGAVTYEGMRFGLYGQLRERGAAAAAGGGGGGGGGSGGGGGGWSILTPGGILAPAVYGMIASLIAGNIIYPNDTIRRRLQTATTTGGTYLGATRALLEEGGLRRLYRGCLLYNLKAAPSAGVQFATFNGLKQLCCAREVAARERLASAH